MTIYLVIDYGQYGRMDVKEYAHAVDVLRELDEYNKFCSVDKIIQGTELTLEELHRLTTKEGT